MKTFSSNTNDRNCACPDQQRHTPDVDYHPAIRSSWREILRAFGSAATRVHRYRDLHTRMVRDALCTQDCHYDEDRSCNDG